MVMGSSMSYSFLDVQDGESKVESDRDLLPNLAIASSRRPPAAMASAKNPKARSEASGCET